RRLAPPAGTDKSHRGIGIEMVMSTPMSQQRRHFTPEHKVALLLSFLPCRCFFWYSTSVFCPDHEWTLLMSRMEDNPLIWMVEINGLPVDIRHAPRQLQEIAFNKGLIPYIPANRKQGE